MRISQKDRKHLASLINTCIVWTDMINASFKNDDVSGATVQSMMVIHNKAGRELNNLLQETAITLYKNSDTGVEY